MNYSPWYDDGLPFSYVRAAEKMLKKVMRRSRWSASDRDALARFLVENFEMKPGRFGRGSANQNGETNEHTT